MELLTKATQKISYFLNKGHQRTTKAKKNIFVSFIVKGLNILIAFALVPIVLNYIDKEQYGIWLTLSSIIGWLGFFDVGLGHGLRNKLSEALANEDQAKAKTYVSTAYALIGAIFLSLLLLFYVVNPFLNWTKILNTTEGYFNELRLVAIIIFTCYCLRFILQLISKVLFALQRPAINDIIKLSGKVVTLILFLVLARTTEGSLTNISLVYGAVPLLVFLSASIYFFRIEYKAIAPSFGHIDFKYARDLLGLGVKFFAVAISGLIVFTTDNFIIIQLYGPDEVPAYALAHKYFGIITMAFSIISVPFWSAYTEAFLKKDINWINATNKGLIKIWVGLSLFGLVLLAGSDLFFSVWIPQIEVPFFLSACMLFYVVVLSWGNIFVTFINGVGKIKLQLIVATIGAVINIPLSIFLAKYCGLGSPGVILASTICICYGPILAPIQFKKIVNGTASGVWSK